MRHAPTMRHLAAFAAALALVTAPAAAQGLSATRLSTDEALVALMPDPVVRAQARAGDLGPQGAHEIALGLSLSSPAATGQLDWGKGAIVPFRLTYDGFGYLRLDMGGETLTYQAGGPLSAIALRASSQRAFASARAFQVSLNQVWIGHAASVMSRGGETDLDILMLQGAGLANGFVLQGMLRLSWYGSAPQGDELALEVCAGRSIQVGQDFCVTTANSSGRSCDLSWSGTTSVSANALALSATGGVPDSACMLLVSNATQSLPMGNGWLCLATPVERIEPMALFDQTGGVGLAVDLAAAPFGGGPLAVAVGDVRYFQLWYRDPLGTPELFNLSDGVALTFVP